MRVCLLTLSLLSLSLCAVTRAETPVVREHMAPPGWEESYHNLHYSPVVKIGNRVIVSGIPAGGPGNKTDEEKIRWMFGQLKAHMEKAGATMEDVVEITSYHVSKDHADFRKRVEPMLKVHHEVFKDHYPAWTAVGVTALFSSEAPVEMRAEAIIGSGKAAKADIPKPTAK